MVFCKSALLTWENSSHNTRHVTVFHNQSTIKKLTLWLDPIKAFTALRFPASLLYSLRLDRFLVVSNPDLSFTSRNMSKKLIFYTFSIFAQLTSVVDTHFAFSSAFIIRISLTSCIASFIRDPCCEWRQITTTAFIFSQLSHIH